MDYVNISNYRRIRITIINDFRNIVVVFDYKEFPLMKDIQEYIISSDKTDNNTNDSIALFLNYQKIMDSKSKDDVWAGLLRLVEESNIEIDLGLFRQGIFGKNAKVLVESTDK